LFLLALNLAAQPISFGIKAGLPLLKAFEGSFGVGSEERPYTVGPMVEVKLPASLALEVNALYRRTGYSTSNELFGIANVGQARANSWEFPILAKYYVTGRTSRLRLFFSGGYVFRSLSGAEFTWHSFGIDPLNGAPFDYTAREQNPDWLVRHSPVHGVAAGLGGGARIGPLQAAPEIRYTRWSARLIDEEGSQGFYARSAKNQLDLLLSLTF